MTQAYFVFHVTWKSYLVRTEGTRDWATSKCDSFSSVYCKSICLDVRKCSSHSLQSFNKTSHESVSDSEFSNTKPICLSCIAFRQWNQCVCPRVLIKHDINLLGLRGRMWGWWFSTRPSSCSTGAKRPSLQGCIRIGYSGRGQNREKRTEYGRIWWWGRTREDRLEWDKRV